MSEGAREANERLHRREMERGMRFANAELREIRKEITLIRELLEAYLDGKEETSDDYHGEGVA